MEKYKDAVAENDKVDMVHISLDRDEKAAQSWAAVEQFPWLTILPQHVERSGLKSLIEVKGVPTYALVKADGEVVAKGMSVFSKAKEL